MFTEVWEYNIEYELDSMKSMHCLIKQKAYMISNSKVLGSIPRMDENFILIPVISAISKEVAEHYCGVFNQNKNRLGK